jgi:hypothetical protein
MDSRFAKVDQEFIALRGEIKTLGATLQGQINTLKWMSSPVALVALIWVAKEALRVLGVQTP